jgi:hypothetical protein
VVVNHKWVKIDVRDGGAQPGDEGKQMWFTIGSVDTFERNLVSSAVLLLKNNFYSY